MGPEGEFDDCGSGEEEEEEGEVRGLGLSGGRTSGN